MRLADKPPHDGMNGASVRARVIRWPASIYADVAASPWLGDDAQPVQRLRLDGKDRVGYATHLKTALVHPLHCLRRFVVTYFIIEGDFRLSGSVVPLTEFEEFGVRMFPNGEDCFCLVE